MFVARIYVDGVAVTFGGTRVRHVDGHSDSYSLVMVTARIGARAAGCEKYVVVSSFSFVCLFVIVLSVFQNTCVATNGSVVDKLLWIWKGEFVA